MWVPDRSSVLQNGPNDCLVGPFLERRWCSAEIPLEEGTSVVGLLGCLVDVLRSCTVLVESHSKVLCCVSVTKWLVLFITIYHLKGHCIEFKYYADGIHSGLTPPG